MDEQLFVQKMRLLIGLSLLVTIAAQTAALAQEWRSAGNFVNAPLAARRANEDLLVYEGFALSGGLLVGFAATPPRVADHLEEALRAVARVDRQAIPASGLLEIELFRGGAFLAGRDAEQQEAAIRHTVRQLEFEGVRGEGMLETRLVSLPLRKHGVRNTHSLYVAHLLPAAQVVVGAQGTVAILYRRDHEHRWVWGGVHFPIGLMRVVSETPVVDRPLRRALGGDGALHPLYVGVLGPGKVTEHVAAWRELRDALRK